MNVMISICFSLSIICLIDCMIYLFPKAKSISRATFAVLLALACVVFGFISLNFMDTYDSSVSKVNWTISIVLLVIFVIVQSAFIIIIRARRSKQN